MKAKIVDVAVPGRPNRTRRIMVRAGSKGTGAILWSCEYWPDSHRSIDEMDRMLGDFVDAHSIELDERNDDDV